MKKLIAMIAAVILILGLTTSAFAAPAVTAANRPVYGCGGGGGGCYGLMWDADGNFLSKEAYSAELDKAINDGLIRSADKSYYLEMYDYCATNGGGAYGMRGGCGMARRWA